MQKIICITIISALISINSWAQCFLDRHNTTWYDGWMSCTTSVNPNPVRGESHWVLYDFNYSYELFQMHIWNTNAPEYLTNGMQEIVIDISNDGVSWSEVGTFQVPMANGTSTYEGLDLYDFEGTNAQYVLITGLSNHGGSCFGLSEIRIDVADEVVVVSNHEPLDADCLSAKIFPNPVNENSKAIISNICNHAPIYYSIQDISGKVLKRATITPVGNEMELDLTSLSLATGTYILSLQQQDVVRKIKMIKVD